MIYDSQPQKNNFLRDFYLTLQGKDMQAAPGAPWYILRPEAVESLFYLHHLTGDPIYREWGWEMWSAIHAKCRTTYGYGRSVMIRACCSVCLSNIK